VLLLAAAAFFLCALITYPGLGADGVVRGDNLVGPVGNAVARWTLAAVGLSVFPLSIVLVVAGLRLILKRGVRVGAGLLLASVAWAVSLAVIFHVAFRGTLVYGAHPAGGAVGELLGEVLCSLFSTTGTYLVATVVVLVAALLSTNLSVAALLELGIRAARWIGRGLVVLLDRLGSLVIRLAERWDREPEPVGDAVVHPGDRNGPTSDAGPPAGESRRTGTTTRPPQVNGKKAAEPEAAPAQEQLAIRHLPEQDGWELPPLTLLDEVGSEEAVFDEADLQRTATLLSEALVDYGVSGQMTDIHPGPVVTLFEYVPQSGTKLSKISGLKDELAMRLEVERVRIVAPIPGKNAVGFEVPNRERVIVGLRGVLGAVLGSGATGKKKMTLPLALGRDIGGTPYGVDLARMPHLIVAGTTGSGKSVCINTLLLSLLFRFTPRDLRLILIDPKEVELGGYNDIPHLLVPVVTDMRKAASALRWAVDEMERRYDLFSRLGSKSIESFNQKVRTLETASEPAGDAAPGTAADDDRPLEPLPYVVVVLDELADLMMVAAREVETAIARLAQKARAAGIHLVVATQRPSTDVMSGTIRNNFPARISFRVSSGTDSRTVLDTQGAESLLGAGDMLVRPPGTADLVRVHGAFVSEDEVKRVVSHLREQEKPAYEESVFLVGEEDVEDDDRSEEEDEKFAERYDQAVALVAAKQKASTSFIQRHLRVGYNTAARLMERMEREGVVGPERGPRPREVLVGPTEPG
jgi:S-DNA-T family DNA segregation ATPase FtsK/SpoIIIE